MQRLPILLAALALCAGVALAQSTPAPAAAAQTAPNPNGLPTLALTTGTVIKGEVETGFNSADSQKDDQVSITSTEDVKQGKIKLPKGTTFSGSVLQVSSAPDHESPASVAVLFDTATTPKGDRYALHAAISDITVKSASSSSASPGGGGGGYGGGGGGYGGRRGRGGMGQPSSGGSSTSTPATQIFVRMPADAATEGSVLSSQRGDFWVYPKTKVSLQVVTNAPPAGKSSN